MRFRFDAKLTGGIFSCLCLSAALGSACVAGELRLSTVRLDLSDRQPASTVTITNDGSEKSVVQVRAMIWTQADGHDASEMSNDLIVNPPIAEIAPGGRQMIRVGYIGKRQSAAEQTYRLQIEEVPLQDHEQAQAISTYLKIIVPVFIAPDVKTAPKLSAHLQPDDLGTVILRNDGGLHIRFVGYSVSHVGDPHRGLYYVLPNSSLALPVTPAERQQAENGNLEIVTDDGPTPVPFSRMTE